MLSEKSKEVDTKVQCSIDALERRGTNVSRSKTKCLRKNEMSDGGKVKL